MCSFLKKVLNSISNGVILPAAMWPVFDSVWNINEYKQYLLKEGSKSGRCLGITTLLLSRENCLDILGTSNSRNLKGFSRPVMEYVYLYFSILK